MAARKVAVADGLPERCFAVTAVTNELVVIVRGEAGCYPIPGPLRKLLQRKQTAGKTRDRLNADVGVTKAQANAMRAGWCVGWHSPTANPANYNKNGSLKHRWRQERRKR